MLEQAATRGHHVRALVRNPGAVRAPAGVELIQGTPSNIDDVRKAAQGSEAVITALNNSRASDNPWAKPVSPPMFMTDVTRDVLTVMGEQDIRRIVVTSGADPAQLNPVFKALIRVSNLKAVNDDHQGVDRVVRASDRHWTLAKQFASNHLGHFALTGLLLDLLQAGRDPRVVTVTSDLHRGSRIDFDDLTGARRYAPMGFNRQSKFANVVFALELDRRLRAVGSPVRSLLAHPGFSATNLQTSGPTGLLRTFVTLARGLMAQDAAMGALPQLYAATAPDVEGGQFFGPDGFRELRGHPTTVRPDPAAEDMETARRLWQLSEDLTGVSYASALSA